MIKQTLLLSWMVGQALTQTSVCFLNGIFTKINSNTEPFTTETINKDLVSNIDNDVCNKASNAESPSKSCCSKEYLSRVEKCQNKYLDLASSDMTEIMRNFKIVLTPDNQMVISQLAKSQSVVRRRRLQTTTIDAYDPKVYINKFLNENEYSDRTFTMLERASKKCWDYYMNKVMAGMTCTICKSPPKNFFLMLGKNSYMFDLTTESCDLLISSCLDTIDIHTSLTELMRNVIILLMQSQFTTTEENNMLYNFLKMYPSLDQKNLVASCRKSASCDNLCKEVFRFGSFENEYIFGNKKIYHSFFKIVFGNSTSSSSTKISDKKFELSNPAYRNDKLQYFDLPKESQYTTGTLL